MQGCHAENKNREKGGVNEVVGPRQIGGVGCDNQRQDVHGAPRRSGTQSEKDKSGVAGKREHRVHAGEGVVDEFGIRHHQEADGGGPEKVIAM